MLFFQKKKKERKKTLLSVRLANTAPALPSRGAHFRFKKIMYKNKYFKILFVNHMQTISNALMIYIILI